MKKFAISLIALAAISTASFAASAGDGADTDSPAVYNDSVPAAHTILKKKLVKVEALSTGVSSDASYINKSQLR